LVQERLLRSFHVSFASMMHQTSMIVIAMVAVASAKDNVCGWNTVCVPAAEAACQVHSNGACAGVATCKLVELGGVSKCAAKEDPAMQLSADCMGLTTKATCEAGPATKAATGSCSTWVIGIAGDAYDCKAGTGDVKTHTAPENGKYCMKSSALSLVSQGCDVKLDKLNEGAGAVVSECEDYGLTTPNACCYIEALGKKAYTMCNKDGFGTDEPKESDFTDALCPKVCKGGQDSSNSPIKQVCFSAVVIAAGLML